MEEERVTRVDLADTVFDTIRKMSEGHRGALQVCAYIMEKGKEIDPDSVLGGLGTLITLDACQIYGGRIWMLFKNVCGEKVIKTIAILRACQLEFLDMDKLNHAIDNNGHGIDVDKLEQQVRTRLPAFGKEEEREIEEVKWQPSQR